MTQEKSFEKREGALKKKLTSRGGLFKYLRAEHSRISSEQQFWLLVFSRKESLATTDDVRIQWYLKFWVWDSHNDSLLHEQIVYSASTTKEKPSFVSSGIDFVHILDKQKLVLIKVAHSDLGIYRFDGTVVQHPKYNANGSGRDFEGRGMTYVPTLYAFDDTETKLMVRMSNRSVVIYDLTETRETHRIAGYETRLHFGGHSLQIESLQSVKEGKFLLLHASGSLGELESSNVSVMYLLQFKNRQQGQFPAENMYSFLGSYTSSWWTKEKPEVSVSDDNKQVTILIKQKETISTCIINVPEQK